MVIHIMDERSDFIIDLIETYFDERILEYSNPGFIKTMIQEIAFFVIREEELWMRKTPDHIVSFIDDNIRMYREMMNIPERQSESVPGKCIILDRIEKHSNIKQRTAEWYMLRHNLFSASNLWKLFSTPGQYNSLIYEKCMNPMQSSNIQSSNIQNTSNPRNWGIKYEPLSILLYEQRYQTKVKTDYGCVPHVDENIHIGASPDGINIDPKSDRYGRLVEVKNIFNREIDGIPSEEYWTQMQIQMEVCNIDECDFLETRFKEYTEEEYWTDDREKGVILFFVSRDTNHSKYVYMPMYVTQEKWCVCKWIEDTQERWSDYILYDTTYWYLDEFSCVLVRRNMVWFERAIPVIQDAWNTVLRERDFGYDHRAPKRRDSDIDEKKSKYLSKFFEKEHVIEIPMNSLHLVKLDEFGIKYQDNI